MPAGADTWGVGWAAMRPSGRPRTSCETQMSSMYVRRARRRLHNFDNMSGFIGGFSAHPCLPVCCGDGMEKVVLASSLAHQTPVKRTRQRQQLLTSANFTLISNLIEKGEARQLRALLTTAPTLRATLRGTTEPALHIAMRRLQLACSAAIMDAGVDTNATCEADGRSALHVAVEAGFLEGVRHLLARKARIELADNLGRTPVHLAAASALPEAESIFALLLESGAGLSHRDAAGCATSHFAAAAGNVRMLELIDELDRDLIGATDQRGATPLHHACAGGALGTISWLLAEGRRGTGRVRIHAATRDGSLPVAEAARAAQHEAVALLIAEGAWKLEQRLPGGQSLLMVSALAGGSTLLSKLLESNADPYARDALGRSALMHAALAGASDCIQVVWGGEGLHGSGRGGLGRGGMGRGGMGWCVM